MIDNGIGIHAGLELEHAIPSQLSFRFTQRGTFARYKRLTRCERKVCNGKGSGEKYGKIVSSKLPSAFKKRTNIVDGGKRRKNSPSRCARRRFPNAVINLTKHDREDLDGQQV